PEQNRLLVYLRRTQLLTRERFGKSFTSPRLKIRFDLTGPEMCVYHPDGRPFLSFEALEEERSREKQRADQAEQQRLATEQRAARLVARSRKARLGQANPEDLVELEQLERAILPPASQ